MADFDPYYKWFGIKPEHQPPHYYRLLGVDLFEDDADVIDTANEQRMTFLHACSNGEHVELAQRMMNEVSKARVVLLDDEQRARYDSELRERLGQNDQPEAPVVTINAAPAKPLSRRQQQKSPAFAIVMGVSLLVLLGVAVKFLGGSNDEDADGQADKTSAKSLAGKSEPEVAAKLGSVAETKKTVAQASNQKPPAPGIAPFDAEQAKAPQQASGVEKTLVAWVTLEDRSVTAGSVLTIQDGQEFDGIVFAELAKDKWMVGSHNWKRTEKAQKQYAPETADDATLIQMAIVYQDEQTSIYRNGKLYANFKAKNIDLLNRKGNFAVMGIRHLGGRGRNGSIAGSIDDARIYSQALTPDQLNALVPNKKSEIAPWAWWDFENEMGKERTGQFPYQRLTSGASVKDGVLRLSRGAKFVSARTQAAANRNR